MPVRVPGSPSQVSPNGHLSEASTTTPPVKSDAPQKGPESQVDLRSNSQRTGNTAGAPTPMAPRKQALKALVKHSWGAVKHGTQATGLAVEKLAHQGTAALSRPESGMAREHEMAGILTKPLVDTELGMAKVHSQAVGRALVDLVKKTRTYDAGHVAEQLAPIKEMKSSSQALKATTLGTPGRTNGLGEQKYEVVFPEIAAPAKRPKIKVPAEAAAHKPHTTAAKAFGNALRSTARGVGHKIMQGLHTTGATVWSNQMSVAFTHKQAAAKHADLATGHFANAGFDMRLSGQSGAIAARKDLAKAGKLMARTAENFRPGRTPSGHTDPAPEAKADVDPVVPPQAQEIRKVTAGSTTTDSTTSSTTTSPDTSPRLERRNSSPSRFF